MSQLQQSGVVRRRMSYDEWLAMPYEGRSEWVDGEAFLMPPVTWRHSTANFELMVALKRDLSGVYRYSDVGLRMHDRVRVPDLMVATSLMAEGLLQGVPILVAEVLSPETRHVDLVAKSTEYLAFGVAQYWIVDPRDRVLDAFASHGEAWEPIVHLDDSNRVGTVRVGDHGDVALDLDVIIPTV